MFVLNSKTKEAIHHSTGIDPEKLPMMDQEEIDTAIEKKIGKTLEMGILDLGSHSPRGNVYIHLKRLISNTWLEKQLSKI
jgi:hypothetical protein